MIELKNDYLNVLINEHGAELTSVKDKDSNEYIWQADKKFWGRHAPILFPIVGRLKDNQYTYQNSKYEMTQHGFARDNDFTVNQESDTSATFSLTQNDSTLQKYPFDFGLTVQYELVDHQLNVTLKVKNPSKDKDLLFSIGAHPGFNVPFIKNDLASFQDYFLRVAPKGNYQQIPLKPPYSDPNDQKTMDLSKPFYLDHELFKNDAKVLVLNGKQTTLMLSNTHDDHGVALTVLNAPFVGIWSPYPKKAPFVCIEPWWGLADTVGASGQLTEKFAINKLAAQKQFKGGFEISFF